MVSITGRELIVFYSTIPSRTGVRGLSAASFSKIIKGKHSKKVKAIDINLIKIKITISVYITKADLVSLVCYSFD